MLSFLSPYKLMIEIFIIGSIIVAIGVGIHKFLSYEQDIGYQRAVAEYTAKELIAEKAARAIETQLRNQIQEAQNAAIKRDQENAVLLTAVNNTASGLRNTTANIRNSLPTATIDSIRKTADALTTVFEDCRSEYAKMGQAAAGHANDVQMIEDAIK